MKCHCPSITNNYTPCVPPAIETALHLSSELLWYCESRYHTAAHHLRRRLRRTVTDRPSRTGCDWLLRGSFFIHHLGYIPYFLFRRVEVTHNPRVQNSTFKFQMQMVISWEYNVQLGQYSILRGRP